jgi:hypothetical protein
MYAEEKRNKKKVHSCGNEIFNGTKFLLTWKELTMMSMEMNFSSKSPRTITNFVLHSVLERPQAIIERKIFVGVDEI